MAFKMKGSPMQRNFGIGSPVKRTGDPEKEMTQEQKDAAIANAMDEAKVETLSRETMESAEKHFGGANASTEDVQAKIKEYESILTRTGLPESSYDKYSGMLKDARRTAKALGR